MSSDKVKTGYPKRFDRRGFLMGGVAVVGAAPFASRIVLATGTAAATDAAATTARGQTGDKTLTAAAPESRAMGYESLSPDEAGFVEAMVNVMCPSDALTANGVDCGLATFIDRQLAGGYGKGERLYMRGPWRHGTPQQGYQLPLTPEQFFKVGIAAANRVTNQRFGKDFADLPPADADAFLSGLAAGTISDPQVPLALWFHELVYPLFVQACFADPMYGGNRNKVFWTLVGYPGLPALHTQDVVEFRGKPYPGAREPKSIVDFS